MGKRRKVHLLRRKNCVVWEARSYYNNSEDKKDMSALGMLVIIWRFCLWNNASVYEIIRLDKIVLMHWGYFWVIIHYTCLLSARRAQSFLFLVSFFDLLRSSVMSFPLASCHRLDVASGLVRPPASRAPSELTALSLGIPEFHVPSSC